MGDLVLEPGVVEEQVRKLNKQADSFGLLGVVVGLPFGAVAGGLPLVAHGPIPSKFGIATLLLGALLAGLVGYMIGSSRAFGYRLRAQLMLGQLRLEQNVQALLAVSERPAPVVALPGPERAQAALPEPPSIDEIVEAGLAMPHALPQPESASTFEWPPVDVQVAAVPTAEVETIAPLPTPEPEPALDPVPTPSWAAAFTAPSSEPEPTPAWAVPAREEPAPEPAPAPKLPTWAEVAEIAPAPTAEAAVVASAEETARRDFGSTMPAWASAAADEDEDVSTPPRPVPASEPADLSSLSIAEIARLADAGSL